MSRTTVDKFNAFFEFNAREVRPRAVLEALVRISEDYKKGIGLTANIRSDGAFMVMFEDRRAADAFQRALWSLGVHRFMRTQVKPRHALLAPADDLLIALMLQDIERLLRLLGEC